MGTAGMKVLTHMDIATALVAEARRHLKAAEDEVKGSRPTVLPDYECGNCGHTQDRWRLGVRCPKCGGFSWADPPGERVGGYSGSLHQYLESWGHEMEIIHVQLETEVRRRREDLQVRLR